MTLCRFVLCLAVKMSFTFAILSIIINRSLFCFEHPNLFTVKPNQSNQELQAQMIIFPCKRKWFHNSSSILERCCCSNLQRRTSKPRCSSHCRSSHRPSSRSLSLGRRSRQRPIICFNQKSSNKLASLPIKTCFKINQFSSGLATSLPSLYQCRCARHIFQLKINAVLRSNHNNPSQLVNDS